MSTLSSADDAISHVPQRDRAAEVSEKTTRDQIVERRFIALGKSGLLASAGIHLSMLLLFSVTGQTSSVFIEVMSLLGIWGCWHALGAGALRVSVYLAMVEASIHGVSITWILGWQTGFHIYPLLAGAIALGSPDRRTAWLSVALCCLSWLWLFISLPHDHVPWSVMSANLSIVLKATNFIAAFVVLGVVLEVMMREANDKSVALHDAHQRTEEVLYNVLPPNVAQRIRDGEPTVAETHRDATVLFADLVSFTELSSEISAEALVGLLNEYFARVDALAERHQVEKIKTIGDSYMAATGLQPGESNSARRMVEFALELLDALEELRQQTGYPLRARVGIHSGLVVAGVIGTSKYAYDLWGDTVNVAARMESSGVVDRIQVSEATAELLEGVIDLHPRGARDIKGKGAMETFLVEVTTSDG